MVFNLKIRFFRTFFVLPAAVFSKDEGFSKGATLIKKVFLRRLKSTKHPFQSSVHNILQLPNWLHIFKILFTVEKIFLSPRGKSLTPNTGAKKVVPRFNTIRRRQQWKEKEVEFACLPWKNNKIKKEGRGGKEEDKNEKEIKKKGWKKEIGNKERWRSKGSDSG